MGTNEPDWYTIRRSAVSSSSLMAGRLSLAHPHTDKRLSSAFQWIDVRIPLVSPDERNPHPEAEYTGLSAHSQTRPVLGAGGGI